MGIFFVGNLIPTYLLKIFVLRSLGIFYRKLCKNQLKMQHKSYMQPKVVHKEDFSSFATSCVGGHRRPVQRHRNFTNNFLTIKSIKLILILGNLLKGQSHEIFLLCFFSSICSFWSYQRCPRAVWNFSKFSQSYWTSKTTPRCFGNRGVALKFWGWELCSNINQMYLYSNY